MFPQTCQLKTGILELKMKERGNIPVLYGVFSDFIFSKENTSTMDWSLAGAYISKKLNSQR